MKTEVKTNQVKPRDEYPALKKSTRNDAVILFLRPKTGTIIHATSNSYRLGHFSESWDEPAFETLPRGSQVILEND